MTSFSRKFPSAVPSAIPFVKNTSKAFVVISEMIRSHEERTSRLERSMQEMKSGHQVTLLLEDDGTGEHEEVTYTLLQVSPSKPVYGKVLRVTSKARISRNPQADSVMTLKPSRNKTSLHNLGFRIPKKISDVSLRNDLHR